MRRLGLVLAAVVVLLNLTGPAWGRQTLTVALTSSPTTLDPAKAKLADEYLYLFCVFQGLTVIDRDLKVKPELAERWESSEDLRTWTFFLRPGVRFHHGREVEAEDVAATVRRLMDREIDSRARAGFLIVDRVEAVDKRVVRFTLTAPYAAFPEIVGERQARIIPRDRIETLASQPVGSGPFMFRSHSPGERLVLVKNPDYWEKGLPLLDEVIFKVVPDPAARVTGLESGELDVAWDLPLESVGRLKKRADVVVEEVPTSSWDGIIMHNGRQPFDDPRVRRALHLAVDKAALVDQALFGHGLPTHSPVSPRDQAYHKGLPFRTDLAQARRLLAEAGHAQGLDLQLYVPQGRAQRLRLGQALRRMLHPLGVRVELHIVPWDRFAAEVEGRAAFSINGFFSRPTVDTALYPWYHSQGSWNAGLWSYRDERVDRLLDQARATRDEAARIKIYQEFQRLVVEEDPPSVVPYVLNQVNAFRKEVRELYSSPMMWFDLRRVHRAQ